MTEKIEVLYLKAMPVFLDNSVYFVLSICSLIVVIDHPLTIGTTLFCSMPARLNRVVCSALTCRSSPLSVSITASIVTPWISLNWSGLPTIHPIHQSVSVGSGFSVDCTRTKSPALTPTKGGRSFRDGMALKRRWSEPHNLMSPKAVDAF